MLYADRPKAHYRRSPLQEVICQLRFPTILRIGHEDPVEFQEQIRSAFPQYAKRLDKAQPKITGLDSGSPRVEQQPPVPNHCFISADNRWKINLTQDFIALSTVQYPGWEAFARQLDRPLAEFIRLYQPAYFQRVGLRYVNFISRERLGLKQVPWRELIAPAYAGILAEPDVQDADVSRCAASRCILYSPAMRWRLGSASAMPPCARIFSAAALTWRSCGAYPLCRGTTTAQRPRLWSSFCCGRAPRRISRSV